MNQDTTLQQAAPLDEHFIDRRLDAPSLERQWAAVQAGIERPDPLAVLARALMGAAAVAAVLLVWWALPSMTQSTTAWEGATLATSEQGQVVTLADGSRVEAHQHTTLEVCQARGEDTCIRLVDGVADFEVAKNAERTFRVKARDVEVRVIGTQFRVDYESAPDAESVTVSVTEGIVEVAAPGATPRRLTAGQRYEVSLATSPEVAANDVEPAAEATLAFEESDLVEPAPKQVVTRRAPKRRAKPKAQAVTPRDLYREARVARRDGDFAGAAALYKDFLKKYPRDRSAPLVELDLGSLYLKELGKSSQAIGHLERAERGLRGKGNHQEALKNLARAYDRNGRAADCARTRDTYLETFPNGAHAKSIRCK